MVLAFFVTPLQLKSTYDRQIQTDASGSCGRRAHFSSKSGKLLHIQVLVPAGLNKSGRRYISNYTFLKGIIELFFWQ